LSEGPAQKFSIWKYFNPFMYIQVPSDEPNSGSGQLNITAYFPSTGFPLISRTLILG